MRNGLHVAQVWDVPIRIVHWLIVALVAAAYVTWRLNWMDWHGWVGDALLVVLFFRLLWGFFGSETARFSKFLASPMTAIQHLKYACLREPDRQVGHNPAGGWMVLLLLVLLLAETLTGLYVANDIADVGPLTNPFRLRWRTRSRRLTRSSGLSCWLRSCSMSWRSRAMRRSRGRTCCAQ